MRLYNKKGISPLIATVLLIGFTVAMGVLVYLWLSGTLSLQAKKGELQCGPDDIADLEFSVPSCSNGADGVTIKVNNQGKKRIDGFWIAMNPTGLTPLEVHNVKPGREEEIGLKSADTVNDVEMIPVVIEDGNVKTCTSNAIKATCEAA